MGDFQYNIKAARSSRCGPHRLCVEMVLLYLDAAEVAVAFEVEGLTAVGGLGVAFAVDAGEGGVDVVHDTDALVNTDFHAAEAAVDIDDGSVAEVGIAQVEADETEGGVHVGALEGLSVEAVVLLAEAHLNLVHLAAVHDDGVRLAGVAMAAWLLLAEEQQRDAPYHGHNANHVFPDVVPRDDVASRQKQQDADAAADDGASLVLVVEDIDEARHDDEECPPAVEFDADQSEEFQGPYDAEGQEGDATDGFASAIHYSIFL